MALISALRDGSISAIATDHAPHARQEKDVPRGRALRRHRARDGLCGPPCASRGARDAPLATLLERMSAASARVFGLDEPAIEVGARANLVALDLDAEWTVTEDGFRSLSNSWLLGETLRGRVVRTIADGREVYAA